MTTTATLPYRVELNPHFGDRGEGRNRFVVIYRNKQGRDVVIGKYMTKFGASTVAARFNASPGVQNG